MICIYDRATLRDDVQYIRLTVQHWKEKKKGTHAGTAGEVLDGPDAPLPS